MAQLWLTYQEIADQLGCEPSEARLLSISRQWERKRSRDGLSRVQVPTALMTTYLMNLMSQHPDFGGKAGKVYQVA